MTSFKTLAKENAALLVSLLIGLLLFANLVSTLQDWRTDWSLTHPLNAHMNGTTPLTQTKDAIASLPDLHLFGKWLAVGNDVPTTNLEMQITGTVKGVGKQAKYNGEPSKVYISISGEPSKIYEEGDTLPSGVKIYDITPTMVILENHGQLEKLPLPRQPLQFKPINSERP